MRSAIIYDRFLWFHQQVKLNRHPNAPALAAQFELSLKTAQRNIIFMKDRLKAPLSYVAERRGYVYEDDNWELPALWLSEEDLTSLLVSYRLASAIPDTALKTSFKSFLEDILARHAPSGNISLDDLDNKISVKNIAFSRTSESIFHPILDALLHSRPITITYFSPHNNEATTRNILPLHLLQYMGTWHIIAHCATRNELRDFVLSRIQSAAPARHAIPCPDAPDSIKDFIRKNFGIMNSPASIEVCLRFAPEIAPWVAEQIWHPEQQVAYESDNTLRLTVPVADFREIKREILKFGSQVEVESPEELRREMKQEIKKMAKRHNDRLKT